MKKKFIVPAVFGIAILSVAALIFVYYRLTNILMYWDVDPAVAKTQREAICSDWLSDVAYGDLRPGAAKGTAVDISCEDIFKVPFEELPVKTETGFALRSRLFSLQLQNGQPPKDDTPIFIHIHGISGNWLHGARYVKMASRLGMRLAVVELSNHGFSANNGLGAALGCREKDDVIALMKYLYTRYPQAPLYLHGTSMGTMAIFNGITEIQELDSHKMLKALAIENPIPSLRHMVMDSSMRPPLPEFLLEGALKFADFRTGLNFDKCRPIDKVAAVNRPTLIYQTVKDDIVPEKFSQLVMDTLPQGVTKEMKVFQNGSHSAVWNGQPEEVESMLASFWTKSQP